MSSSLATVHHLTGSSFDDVLNELHMHAFAGVPGESSFVLSLLEREYIAYALACYYQCEHCRHHHANAIERELRRLAQRTWPWQAEIETSLLYLRHKESDLSKEEWPRWKNHWANFASRVLDVHGISLDAIGYAVGIARADKSLMHFIWDSLNRSYPNNTGLEGVVRDIFRVVVFMKAATTKNRVIDVVEEQLVSRGIG